MPPRASHRRTARGASREPEPEQGERPGQFTRPHLPTLTGTPSSRRQYSYGSALEPPRRPAPGSQRVDIDQAVNEALTRRPHDIDDGGFVRPPVPRARPTFEDDEDADDEPPHPRTTTRRGATSAQEFTTDAAHSRSHDARNPTTSRNTVAGSDADSLRSFNMESDYYGDATIASTPGTTATTSALREASDNRGLKRSSNRKQVSKSEPEDTPQTRPTGAAEGRPVRPGVGQRVGRNRPQQPPESSPDLREDEELEVEEQVEEEVEDEEETNNEEYDPADPALGHQKYTNTPLPKRFGSTLSRDLRPRRGARRMDDKTGDPAARARRTRSPEIGGAAHMAKIPSPTGPPKIVSRDGSLVPQAVQGQPPASTQASAPPQLLFGTDRRRPGEGILGSFDPSTHPTSQDWDAAIQKEILETQELVDRQERALEREREQQGEARASFGGIWGLIRPYLTFEFLRRRERQRQQQRQQSEEIEDLGADEQYFGVGWSQLLSPRMYAASVVLVLDTMMDYIIYLIDRIPIPGIEQIPRPGRIFRWVFMTLFGLALSAALFKLLPTLRLSTLPSLPPLGVQDLPSVPGLGLPNLGGITGKISDSIPSFAWPSSDGVEDSWDMKKNPKDKATPYLKRYDQELKQLKKSGKIHQASLEVLEKILPKVVHMKLKDGRPVIAQEFWHALRDLIHEDDSILTFADSGWGRSTITEKRWQKIIGKLLDDPTFNSKLNATLSGYDRRMEQKISDSWRSWIKSNDNEVLKILGPELDKIQAAGSTHDFDKRIGKLIKEALKKNKDLSEVIVSRDDFLSHLKMEFAVHRNEIRAELEELQPGLEKLIRDSVKAANTSPPQGITKKEIEILINSVVRRRVADMNLDAMAKGKIRANWDDELKSQINYFNVGAGATIDTGHTSPCFRSKGSYDKGVRGVHPNPAQEALLPWEDEGDCFCATRKANKRGNPFDSSVSISMAHHVIPEQIVVEHILPGASNHPDARPKDIEVWAHIEDDEIRDRIKDFAAAHFPEDTENWNYRKPGYDEHFVKIGQFVYEGAEAKDGVYIHRLSSELVELNAATSQVAIRAISNYGAEKQTCFYRLRLYGQPVDYVEGEGASETGSKK